MATYNKKIKTNIARNTAKVVVVVDIFFKKNKNPVVLSLSLILLARFNPSDHENYKAGFSIFL